MDLLRSGLLKDQDQQKIKRAIPKASNKVIETAVARLYVAHPNPNQWTWTGLMGAICLVDDLVGHTWYLKLVDIEGNMGVLWDQELYVDFQYNQDRTFFHSFDLEECQAGLLFEDRHEAARFIKKIQQRAKFGSKATNANKQGLVRAAPEQANADAPPPVPAAPTAINTGFKTRVKAQVYYDDEIPIAWRELYQLLFANGVTEEMIASQTDFIKEYIREYGGPLSGLEPPVPRRFSARAAISAPAPNAPSASSSASRRAPPPPPPPPPAQHQQHQEKANNADDDTSSPEVSEHASPSPSPSPAVTPRAVPPAAPTHRNVPPAPAPRQAPPVSSPQTPVTAPSAAPSAAPVAPPPRTGVPQPPPRAVPQPPSNTLQAPQPPPRAVPQPPAAVTSPALPSRSVPTPPVGAPASPAVSSPPPPPRAPAVPPKGPAPPQRVVPSTPHTAPSPVVHSPPTAAPAPVIHSPPAAPAPPTAPAQPAAQTPTPPADPGYNALMASITQAGGSSSLRKTGKNPANSGPEATGSVATPPSAPPRAPAVPPSAPPAAPPRAPAVPPSVAPAASVAPPSAPPRTPAAPPSLTGPPAPPAPPAPPLPTGASAAPAAPPLAPPLPLEDTAAPVAPPVDASPSHNALMAAITQSSAANLKKTDKTHLERPSALTQQTTAPAGDAPVAGGAPNMASAIAAALSQRRKGVMGSDEEDEGDDWD